METQMSIVVVGSVALDSVETPERRVEEVLGGSATYFAWSASYFAPVKLVGQVGEDFPEEHSRFLRQRDIDLEGLKIAPGETFRWSGRYGKDPNQRETICVSATAFEDFSPELPPGYRSSPYIFLANIEPRLQLEVLAQMGDPRLVICDTMNLWIERQPAELREILGKVDIFLLNDSEARQLTGEENLLQAGRKLLGWGPHYLVIKKGEHGALLLGEELCLMIPGYPVEKVVDPTGAGDCFGGGFVGCLAEQGGQGEDVLRRALVYGSVLGSFCVEGFSFESLEGLTREKIEERAADLCRMTVA